MERILDLLANFDYLYLPQVIIESLWHASWKNAYQRGGFIEVCVEALRSLAGMTSQPFFVPINRGWSGHGIHQLLAKHGIAMWGWNFAHGQMFFRVKKRQAPWAQYVMLRAGVPLQGPLLAQAPDASTATSATSKHQSQRSAGSANDPTLDFEQQFDGLIEKVSSFLDL